MLPSEPLLPTHPSKADITNQQWNSVSQHSSLEVTDQPNQKEICCVGTGVAQEATEGASGNGASPGPSWEPLISPLGTCVFAGIIFSGWLLRMAALRLPPSQFMP
jgi:hypothetical protein